MSANQPINKPGSEYPGSANFSDAMTKMGLRFRTLDAGLRPVTDAAAFIGRAFTVSCYPGATYFMERAVEEAPAGSVIVADGRGFGGGVLMGGLMGSRAFHRGVAAVVIDGAVRDTDELEKIGKPVFARHVTPAAGVHEQAGNLGEPIVCGGVQVLPGDWIVGDRDGVVCVPASRWDEVESAARAIYEKEEAIAAAIARGASLAEAVSESTPGEALH